MITHSLGRYVCRTRVQLFLGQKNALFTPRKSRVTPLLGMLWFLLLIADLVSNQNNFRGPLQTPPFVIFLKAAKTVPVEAGDRTPILFGHQ